MKTCFSNFARVQCDKSGNSNRQIDRIWCRQTCTGMEIGRFETQSKLCKELKLSVWGKVGHEVTSGIAEGHLPLERCT